MKSVVIGLACCLIAGLATPNSATADELHYELQVFRLDGAFRTETSLAPEIIKDDRAQLDKIKYAVTLFNAGSFHWESDELQLNHRGCFWNGKKLTFEEGYREPLPVEKLTMIYSPAVTMKAGKTVRLKIESDAPVQYMQRKANGDFKLLEQTMPVGMDLEVQAVRRATEGFRIEHLEIELRSVGSREKIPNVNLPIGKPNVREWKYTFGFNVEPRKGYGILVRPEGTAGAMLIRIAVSDAK